LEPLAALRDDRPVIFYDQLGCGKSDIPTDLSLYELSRFVEELAEIRRALNLDRVHLLGHSWGGFVAIEYMAGDPDGIVGLVLSSTAPSTAAFAEAARSLIPGLPNDVRETIERCEAAGTTDTPEYEAASMTFLTTHVYRGEQPWPDALMRSFQNNMASPVYGHMWGPSEFNPVGNLVGWDREADMSRISVPTLVTCGRYDEATPAATEAMQKIIPGSELKIFENSAHMGMLEETDVYVATLRDFMRRAEAA
jgi:proline iminopeptidase